MFVREQIKACLRRTPSAYWAVAVLYENASYPAHILRQGLARTALGLPRSLPAADGKQSLMTWDLTVPGVSSPIDLIALLRSHGIPIVEGGHTYYVAPHAALRQLLPDVVRFYPEGVGFKILKDFRDPTHAKYVFKHRRGLRILQHLIGPPRNQLTTANYMHWLGIGPRVWDLTCWRVRESCCTVFVVDHVSGQVPTVEQCTSFLTRLEELNATSHLRILIPEWQRHTDFRPPDCNGNLLYSDRLGCTQYVDFQNFGLTSQTHWSREAAGASWTWDADDVDAPNGSLLDYVRHNRVSPGGRIVLDVGCRNGAAIQALLAAGAAWGIGWCEPEAAPRIEQTLLSRGVTRFSLIPLPSDPGLPLAEQVPVHLQDRLEGSIAIWHRARA